MTISNSELVFACYSAACAPPQAGGSGGSLPGGKSGGGGGGGSSSKSAVGRAASKASSGGGSGGSGGGSSEASIKGGFLYASDGTKLGKIRKPKYGAMNAKVHGESVSGNYKELKQKAQNKHDEKMARGRTKVSSGERRSASTTSSISAVQQERYSGVSAKLGRSAKATDVTIGRDGIAKIKGEAVANVKMETNSYRHKTNAGGKKGYSLSDPKTGESLTFNGYQPRTYPNQKSAKAALAREINNVRPTEVLQKALSSKQGTPKAASTAPKAASNHIRKGKSTTAPGGTIYRLKSGQYKIKGSNSRTRHDVFYKNLTEATEGLKKHLPFD